VFTCFAVLRLLSSIRRSVSRPMVQSLVMSIVLSRLDYGNATLAGISQHLLQRLQSVMNAAAQLIYSSSMLDHTTPLLHQLHWMKAMERIDPKLAVLVFKCVHGSAPPHLADKLSRPADSLARDANESNGHASVAHNSIGRHLARIRLNTTSSESNLPTLLYKALNRIQTCLRHRAAEPSLETPQYAEAPLSFS